MENCNTFGDKDMATDLLNSEKAMTGKYNTALCESATDAVRQTLSSILNNEHVIQEDLFDAINAKGWYPAPKAEQTKLDDAKTKFQNTRASM